MLESFGALDQLIPFACQFGRQFYGIPIMNQKKVTLVRQPFQVPEEYVYVDDEGNKRSLVPFMAGKSLAFSIEFL